MSFSISINGISHDVDVDADTPLLWVLRDVLGMTGTKFGCGMALCGACTVHMDGSAIRSCITTIDSIGDAKITVFEELAAPRHQWCGLRGGIGKFRNQLGGIAGRCGRSGFIAVGRIQDFLR